MRRKFYSYWYYAPKNVYLVRDVSGDDLDYYIPNEILLKIVESAKETNTHPVSVIYTSDHKKAVVDLSGRNFSVSEADAISEEEEKSFLESIEKNKLGKKLSFKVGKTKSMH